MRARQKAKRLHGIGLSLSLNDKRIILISQFLVEAWPQRAVEELLEILPGKLGACDLAAADLLPAGLGGKEFSRTTRSEEMAEGQLTLF
jgi:hypothetical protein